MLGQLKRLLRKALPRPAYNFLLTLRNPGDWSAFARFLGAQELKIPVSARLQILKQLHTTSVHVDSPHTQAEILAFMQTIISLPPEGKGVIVEAGCYKGSSTAKFSLAAELVGRELVVFDSFRGLPENAEPHETDIFGNPASFTQGKYHGSLIEVKANAARFGSIGCCRFVEGWFEDTLPELHEPVAAAYLDVDLASSTRTCLKYLYPLLEPGGVLYSQDGHLPLVIQVLADQQFWHTEVGSERPHIEGLGTKKLVRMVKPVNVLVQSRGLS